MPHIGLAGQVEDHFGPLGRNHPGQTWPVEEVRATVDPVGSCHVVPARAQVCDQVVPHEAGRTGHQSPHRDIVLSPPNTPEP